MSDLPHLLSFTLDGWPVLGGPVTITLNDGVAVLVGRNGAGKSAILEGFRAIAYRAVGRNKAYDPHSFYLLNRNIDDSIPDNIPKILKLEVLTPTNRRIEYKYEFFEKPTADEDDSIYFLEEHRYLFHEYCQYLDEKREFIWKIQDSNIEKIKGSNQSRFNDFAVFFRRQTSLLDFLSSQSGMPDEVKWIYDILTEILFCGEYALFLRRSQRLPCTLIRPNRGGGRFPEELPDLLAREILTLMENDKQEELERVCQRLGLGNSITKKERPLENEMSYIEILFDGVNIGLLSEGTLRILSIILDLINLKPITTLLIEEPETQIHPGMLEKLLNEIESYTHGQNLILSTHSPQVVSWTQPDKINLVYRKNGQTFVRKLATNEIENVVEYLNEEGDLGDWIYSGILDE
jgi:AAA15 family ATPase/GTPase